MMNNGRVFGITKPMHFLNHTVPESEARGGGSKSNLYEVRYGLVKMRFKGFY